MIKRKDIKGMAKSEQLKGQGVKQFTIAFPASLFNF